MEKQAYFYRKTILSEFLEGKSSGKIQKKISLSLVRKQSEPLALRGFKPGSKDKEKNYLSGKKHAI